MDMLNAKRTTFEKAMSQKRLLNAVEHGWAPGRRHSTVKKMPMYPKGTKLKGMKSMKMSGM